VPAPSVVVGATIVVGSGLFILYRDVMLAEGRAPVEPSATPPAQPSAEPA
jgi:hypothetical protein